jgi:hypothetical protein
MYGNDKWGNCVWVAIEKNRVITAESLGVQITKLTAPQVIANYCDFTGVRTAPGPGSNILDALKWTQNHPERFGGNKLMFYGDFPVTANAAKGAVAEFGSFVAGCVVYASMEYPARVWYNAPRGANVGGHGIPGGSYTATWDGIKTWGYEVEVNSAGFDTFDEIVVCIWDFQWQTLTYARQQEIAYTYTYYTGKPWTGPAPIKPIVPEVTVPSVIVLFTTMPPRMCDSRPKGNVGTAARPLAPGESRVVQIAGLNGIPVDATGLIGNLTVTNEAAAGWVSVTPIVPTSPYSTVNFPGPDSRANGFIAAIVNSAVVVHNGSPATTDFIIDASGYLIPA